MKLKRCLSITILFLMMLLACDGSGTPGSPFFRTSIAYPRTDLYRVGLYSFPGMRRLFVRIEREKETVFSRSRERVEKDSYGREYCIFWFPGCAFYDGLSQGKSVHNAIVVLQACKDDKIFYYEDYCFRIIPEGGLSETELSEFLYQNDWGKPFQEGKCSSRDYTRFPESAEQGDFEGMPMKEEFSFYVFAEENKWFPNEIAENRLSEDKNGNMLLWIVEEKEEEYTSWFVIVPPIIKNFDFSRDAMRVDTLDFGPALHAFKTEHNWAFE